MKSPDSFNLFNNYRISISFPAYLIILSRMLKNGPVLMIARDFTGKNLKRWDQGVIWDTFFCIYWTHHILQSILQYALKCLDRKFILHIIRDCSVGFQPEKKFRLEAFCFSSVPAWNTWCFIYVLLIEKMSYFLIQRSGLFTKNYYASI